jgi:hypothetical protein
MVLEASRKSCLLDYPQRFDILLGRGVTFKNSLETCGFPSSLTCIEIDTLMDPAEATRRQFALKLWKSSKLPVDDSSNATTTLARLDGSRLHEVARDKVSHGFRRKTWRNAYTSMKALQSTQKT